MLRTCLCLIILIMAASAALAIEIGPIRDPAKDIPVVVTTDVSNVDASTTEPQMAAVAAEEEPAPRPPETGLFISAEGSDNGPLLYVANLKLPNRWALQAWLNGSKQVEAFAVSATHRPWKAGGLMLEVGGQQKWTRGANGVVIPKVSISTVEPDTDTYLYARANLVGNIPQMSDWEAARRQSVYQSTLAGGIHRGPVTIGLLMDLSGNGSQRNLSLGSIGGGLECKYQGRFGSLNLATSLIGKKKFEFSTSMPIDFSRKKRGG